MDDRGKTIVVTGILSAACLIVAGATVSVLYQAAFAEERARMAEVVEYQARLIEAVARYGFVHSQEDHPDGAAAATLSQIADAFEHHSRIGSSGELVLGRRDRGQIEILISDRSSGPERRLELQLDGVLAEPMRLALDGRSGTVVGLDYRGNQVLAAYDLVKELDLGIVAKINMAEIRGPFIRAGILAVAITIVVVGAGAALTNKIMNPMIHNLEDRANQLESLNQRLTHEVEQRKRAESILEDRVTERTARLRSANQQLEQEADARRMSEKATATSDRMFKRLVQSAPDAVVMADSDGRIVLTNKQTESLFGYDASEMLGHPVEMLIPDPVRQVHTAHRQEYIARPQLRPMGAGRDLHGSRKDGTLFPVSISLSPVESEAEVNIISIIRDVTETTRVQAELDRYRQHLEELVAERTRDLEEARDRAQVADRLKSTFLAAMSHELRTPLNSILGFTGILVKGYPGPLTDEQKKQLHMVQNSARHLLGLINEVLDLSKIEAGQLEIRISPFDLGPVIAEVALGLTPQAEMKGISLAARMTTGIPQIHSDHRRVEQILINLIGNAVKFTDAGEVRIDCASTSTSVTVSIQDSGIGIRPEDLGTIFGSFRQIDSGLARQREGTGLGLSISKKLAEMLGGTIQVDSEWGVGSTFELTLPLNPEEAP